MILFILCSGISYSIMVRRMNEKGMEPSAFRARMLARAVFIDMAGYLLIMLNGPFAGVLPAYAMLFLLALPAARRNGKLDRAVTVFMYASFVFALLFEKTASFVFWDEFSGWYLEMVKPAYQQPIDRATLDATLGFFDKLLRVLHPFMPFLTEELWQNIAPRKDGESLMMSRLPEVRCACGEGSGSRDAGAEGLLAGAELLKEAVSGVRNIRKEHNLPNKEALELCVIADENYPAAFAPLLEKMANLSAVRTVGEKLPDAAAFVVKTTQYFVPLPGKIDAAEELPKLEAELEYLEGFLASVNKKLSNERFVQSAPEKVVANERAKQADAEAKIAALRERIAALK